MPVQPESELNFEDNWDYNIDVQNSPILNGSSHYYILPLYSFATDLTVKGLHENGNDTLRLRPLLRESKIAADMIRSKLSCNVCNLGVGLLYREVKNGTSFDEIKDKFVSLCVALNIETFDVCTGVFNIYGPEVIPVIEMISIGPHEICKLVFGEICTGQEVTSHEWKIDFPPVVKPAVITPSLPQVDKPVLKVLHISDTHYDLDYVEGSVANCQEPLCCRTYSTIKENEEIIPAGKWGSYEKCDAPKILLENMLQHITLQHPDIDYILWTGDLPPHDIWNQTKEYNLEVIRNTVDMVSKAYPGTPIFPAIGNHESSPAGNFAPPWMKDSSHSASWLYKEIGVLWSRWLPSTTQNSVFHGAFYSVLLRPGFRIISINTNYCHSLSWWLLLNSTDPANELKWLIHELQKAENTGEKVHIIGHIPPGSPDCMKSWSSNFYNIVNRYESTILALFYGHSHADEFETFYDPANSSRATAVAYIAPSVTSFTKYNPAYRIYYVDGDHQNTTREVLDFETWTFQLNIANDVGPEPYWYRLYSAKETYNLSSLRPNDWNDIIDKMSSDEQFFNIFYRNYYRNSLEMPSCELKCRMQILCDLKSAKSHSRHEICYKLETSISK